MRRREDEVHAAVRRILDLAEEYYEIGNEGIVYLPSAVRPAIRVAAAVYREIGTQIRRCDYRVLQGRIVTPKFRFVSCAFTAWACGVVRRRQAEPWTCQTTNNRTLPILFLSQRSSS